MGLAGNQVPHAEAAARVKLAEELSGASSHIWAVGQSGGEHLILPGGGIGVDRELIDIQLVNCLPVPRTGTPYTDILEFRAAHGPELVRLRLALDELRERILSSADERRMMEATLHELGGALGGLHAALRGYRLDHAWKTLSLYRKSVSRFLVLSGRTRLSSIRLAGGFGRCCRGRPPDTLPIRTSHNVGRKKAAQIRPGLCICIQRHELPTNVAEQSHPANPR